MCAWFVFQSFQAKLTHFWVGQGGVQIQFSPGYQLMWESMDWNLLVVRGALETGESSLPATCGGWGSACEHC